MSKKKHLSLNNGKSERSNKHETHVSTGLDIQAIEKQNKKDHSFLNNGSVLSKWLNKKFNSKKYQQNKNALYKRYNSQQFDHTTIDHLGYKGLTKDDPSTHYNDKGRHYLILADDLKNTSGYAEMIRIGGTSLSDLPITLIYQRMSMFINFLSAFTPDIKFISLPLPNDSRLQQHEWQQVDDDVRQDLLNPNLTNRQRAQLLARHTRIEDSIDNFKDTDRTLINQGFIMMIFDETIEKLQDDVQQAYTLGGRTLNLTPMTERQKAIFLRHLNNPNEVQTM